MKKLAVALLMSSSLLTSCATLLNGETQKINLSTYSGKPEKVNIDGKTYEVPGVVEVKRQNKDIVIIPEKCPEQQQVLQKKPSGLPIVLNVLFFIPGLTTDYVTGSMWEYDNNAVVGCKK